MIGFRRYNLRPHVIVIIAFVLSILMQAYLVFTKGVNWDEFFHFQHIYELRSGALHRSLQVFYIHAFSWLFDLPLSPIDQLLIGRLVLVLCVPITGAAIYGVARRFTDTVPALLCALAYTTGGYVFLHGFAFRADPLATAMLMGSLWLFGTRRLSASTIMTVSLLLATAMMITVKAAFYAPAFAGLFWLRLKESKAPAVLVRHCIVIALTAPILFAILFQLHSMTVIRAPIEASGRELTSAGRTVFSSGFLPQSGYLIRQAILAPYLTVAILIAPFLWSRRLSSRAQLAAMIGLALPLATILFYRNSYPYFYVFVLAPFSVTLFPVFEWLAQRAGAMLCSLVLVGQAATLVLQEQASILNNQRSISKAVHKIFSEPVAYVDFCGFITDFPRVLPFLTSGWGLQEYRRRGQPILVQRMAREPVPLVLNNASVLDAAINKYNGIEKLLPADAKALRENYVHYWGPIWVAGKQISPGAASVVTNISVPGKYTVEGATLHIGGRPWQPGDVIYLVRGEHLIVPDRQSMARLRWGDRLTVPSEPAPSGPLFSNF